MPMYRVLGWATVEVKYIRGKRGTKNTVTKKSLAYETTINRNSGKIQDVFALLSKWIRRKIFLYFRNIRPNFGTSIERWSTDVFILSKWYICKKANLVWYFWTGVISPHSCQGYVLPGLCRSVQTLFSVEKYDRATLCDSPTSTLCKSQLQSTLCNKWK